MTQQAVSGPLPQALAWGMQGCSMPQPSGWGLERLILRQAQDEREGWLAFVRGELVEPRGGLKSSAKRLAPQAKAWGMQSSSLPQPSGCGLEAL